MLWSVLIKIICDVLPQIFYFTLNIFYEWDKDIKVKWTSMNVTVSSVECAYAEIKTLWIVFDTGL